MKQITAVTFEDLIYATVGITWLTTLAGGGGGGAKSTMGIRNITK
jgi:hypothetical protein